MSKRIAPEHQTTTKRNQRFAGTAIQWYVRSPPGGYCWKSFASHGPLGSLTQRQVWRPSPGKWVARLLETNSGDSNDSRVSFNLKTTKHEGGGGGRGLPTHKKKDGATPTNSPGHLAAPSPRAIRPRRVSAEVRPGRPDAAQEGALHAAVVAPVPAEAQAPGGILRIGKLWKRGAPVAALLGFLP